MHFIMGPNYKQFLNIGEALKWWKVAAQLTVF